MSDLVAAAVHAVIDQTGHDGHAYSTTCPVCNKDLAAILAIAAPVLTREVRVRYEDAITFDTTCTSCGHWAGVAYEERARADELRAEVDRLRKRADSADLQARAEGTSDA